MTRTMRFRIRAAPAQMIRNVEFSATYVLYLTTSESSKNTRLTSLIYFRRLYRVEVEATAEGEDKRRIVSLDERVEDKQAEIHLSHLPIQPKATQ